MTINKIKQIYKAKTFRWLFICLLLLALSALFLLEGCKSSEVTTTSSRSRQFNSAQDKQLNSKSRKPLDNVNSDNKKNNSETKEDTSNAIIGSDSNIRQDHIAEKNKVEKSIGAEGGVKSSNGSFLSSKRSKNLLYDLAHSEIFSVSSQAGLGYSILRDIFIEKGFSIKTNSNPISKELLYGIDTVIIAGPMLAFSESEISNLVDFVKAGGNILITMHTSEPALLVKALGFQVSNAVVAQNHDTFESSTKNFYVNKVVNDFLTSGVKSIAVRKSWALLPIAQNCKNIIFSASDSWIDINPDEVYENREPVSAYGLVGVTKIGNGLAIVIGDDGVFTNKTMTMADNRKLCENIAMVFSK